MNSLVRASVTLTLMLVLAAGANIHAQTPELDAARELFETRCATCHTEDPEHAPPRAAIALWSPGAIVRTLTEGSMAGMAEGLSQTEIESLASWISVGGGWETGTGEVAETPVYCENPNRPLQFDAPSWNGFTRDIAGSRYQPDPGLSVEDIPRLRVKWAFALDGNIHSQPTVIGDRVFISSIGGKLYSLDVETGCIQWHYETAPGRGNFNAGARSTVIVGTLEASDGTQRYAAYLGDDHGFAHGVDAVTGEQLWRTRIDDNPGPRITGSGVLHEGVLYMPVSSYEEASAGADTYECCRFRGSVVALDAASGEILWKSYSIQEEPAPFQLNRIGVQMYGPSGAAIWSTPTLDPERGLLYATTGNSYTDVSTDGANAIIAWDMETGEIRWKQQVMADDNYIAAGCRSANPPANCPEDPGPDFDFGAPAIVRDMSDGSTVVVAADKGAMVYGADADTGELLWRTRVGAGGALGGVQWGMAADDEYVYVAVADTIGSRGDRKPGLNRIRISDGELIWHTPAPPPQCSWSAAIQCSHAMSGAVTLIPGAVLAGSLDGHIRAFNTDDGSLIWAFDTARIYEAVNDGLARGGSLDGPGPVIVDGRMFMTSGYERFAARMRGNALLMFTVDGQ